MLVSTLDSTLRLFDKSNGKLLQSYTHPDYLNTTYRLRSTLGADDALAIAGSEDGYIYAWDILSGAFASRMQHNPEQATAAKGSRKIVSAVAHNRKSGEWASAGGDGRLRHLCVDGSIR